MIHNLFYVVRTCIVYLNRVSNVISVYGTECFATHALFFFNKIKNLSVSEAQKMENLFFMEIHTGVLHTTI